MLICEQLKRLNPKDNFFWSDTHKVILTSCPLENIKCPEGFYVRDIRELCESQFAELTNKHPDGNGPFERYTLVR